MQWPGVRANVGALFLNNLPPCPKVIRAYKPPPTGHGASARVVGGLGRRGTDPYHRIPIGTGSPHLGDERRAAGSEGLLWVWRDHEGNPA